MLSSVEKLQKFFRLEIERGFDNRAVVGGLDKILPAWESEARANRLSDELIQTIITNLRTYPTLDPTGRAEMLSRMMSQLEQGAAQGSTAPHGLSGAQQGPSLPDTQNISAGIAAASSQVIKPASFRETATEFPEDQDSQSGPSEVILPADEVPTIDRRSQPQPRPAQPERQPGPQQRGGAKVFNQPDSTGLSAPVRVLKGVGGQLSQTLSGLGLNTLEDLLYYFPRRYDDYSQLKPINRLAFGEETTVLGTVQNVFTRPIRGGKMNMTEAVVTDGTGSMRVNWFNKPWLASKLTSGTQVVLAGKVDQYMGRLTMTNPEMEPIEAEHLHTNRIVPVYSLTARLTQKNLRRLMYQTVTYWASRVPDYLPERVRSAVKLVALSTALANVHFPESQDMLDVARWRLAFDEIFLLQLGVLSQKRSWQTATAQIFEAPQDWLQEQVNRLPFSLTNAQKRVIEEIRADLASGRPMDRLVQGDVGSGKTVVAAMAIAIVARQGAQTAIMAPTSILAEQHYRTFSRLLTQPSLESPAPMHPEAVRLLVGDTPEAEKQEIRAGLADGTIKVLIGTHALIESPVQFQRLQLAVIDEQHRFGVAQRSALRSKGENPHLLVMTATPIPRSLALTVYGDLDLSVMDEMPAGRQPVSTHVLRPVERGRAYNLIRAQINEGHQAFIIYPMVQLAEGAPSEDTPSGEGAFSGEGGEEGADEQPPINRTEAIEQATVLAAVEEHRRLQNEIFRQYKVGLLHGRLKPEEKDQVMKAFLRREYDILVSTTVVEVGVDVPNATVMLIEGANRFGLAQLHQLRGRVGRGSVQSYCLLIPDKEDAIENERLAVMAETSDGFVLAERDLQQRGPGEFLGTRQAGFSELQMANLTDVRLIEKARQQAQALFQNDPELTAPEHQLLAKKLSQFWGGGRGDVS